MATALPDLNLLRVFLAVAGAGSFIGAAERLGVTRPRVSQQIRVLEKTLGVQLFQRTTRRVAMTQAGQALQERCGPLLLAIDESLRSLDGADAELTGKLRISASVELSSQLLAPVVSAFADLHPKLQVQLEGNDRVSDLVGDGIDVAIRSGWLRDSTLRMTKLADFQQAIVASPDYLRRVRPIKVPADLARCDWVALTLLRTPLTVSFRRRGRSVKVRMASHLRTDSSTVLRALLLAGAGLSLVSLSTLRPELASGQLVQVLPQWELPSGGVYAVYPPGPYVARASRAFVEFLKTHAAFAGS